MWAVIYGGAHDGLALLVEADRQTIRLPEFFDLKRHAATHDYDDGEFEYERTDRQASGFNVSGKRQLGMAFTPKKLESV